MAEGGRALRTPQRVAAVTRLLPEKEPEYRELHVAVWPGVLEALKRANISNYSIFLRDGYLFSYLASPFRVFTPSELGASAKVPVL
jgi:L-rhamnose mutarotase